MDLSELSLLLIVTTSMENTIPLAFLLKLRYIGKGEQKVVEKGNNKEAYIFKHSSKLPCIMLNLYCNKVVYLIVYITYEL